MPESGPVRAFRCGTFFENSNGAMLVPFKLREPQMKNTAWLLLAGISVAASSACMAADTPKRIIGVLVYDKVLTSDVTGPLEVFGKAVQMKEFENYQVVAIAPEKKLITTDEGLMLMPQYSIDDAPALDALIVGSAYDMQPVLENAKLMQWVASNGKTARWMASNCSGARVLGDANLLVGRRATTYPGGELAMQARYLRTTVVVNGKVVIDGNLVTSNGSLVSYTAALKLLEQMSTPAFAKKIAAHIQYDRLVPLSEIQAETSAAPATRQ